MTYERYIKRNGKRWGPYVYKSVRKGNKVISVYVGKGEGFTGSPIREESDSVKANRKIARLKAESKAKEAKYK